MLNFSYHTPTEILFGSGTEEKVGELVRKYGGTRVFVIYGGQSAVKSGLIERVQKSIRSAGLDVIARGGVVPNPILSKVRELIREALSFQADFILAVGGGSVIDTAKAVSFGTAEQETDVWDFWIGKKSVQKRLPVGSVLTISAAGSETSDSAVITNDETDPWSKRGINTPLNRCVFSIMDPELTMTLPKYQVGAGAADIFMHTAERYFTPVRGNYLTDEIACGLFRTVVRFGPAAVEDPGNYEAMSELMWAGSISHIGLTGLGSKGNTPREGDWACHQLGMAVSAVYDSTHGATLTAVFGSWARYVMDADPSRFASFARNIYGITEPDEAKAAVQGIEQTEKFFKALHMPVSMKELLGHSLTVSELDKLTDVCSFNGTRTIGSFKVLDKTDIRTVFQNA